MDTYKVPAPARRKAYWEQPIINASIGQMGGGLGNCGLGMIGSFCGQPFDERRVRRDAVSNWHSYLEWFEKDLTRVQNHFHCPREVENAEQYVQWVVSEKYKPQTLAAVCKEEHDRVCTWLRSGPYNQIVFSGCASEFVPKSRGQGAYHKGFHAGRFAAWLAYTGKTVYAGPLSFNANHNSWIQVWTWVPDRSKGIGRVAETTYRINKGVYL